MKYIASFLAFAYLVYQEFKEVPAPIVEQVEVAEVAEIEYIPQQRAFAPILPLEKKEDDELISLIKRFENFSPTVYKCQGGVDTIGYGITDPEVVKRGILTEEEASEILKEEINVHLSYVDSFVKKPITEQQRNALASFSFNCGDGSLRKIAARINNGKMKEAGDAILLYVYAKGKPSNGLKNRRKIEYQMFNS